MVLLFLSGWYRIKIEFSRFHKRLTSVVSCRFYLRKKIYLINSIFFWFTQLDKAIHFPPLNNSSKSSKDQWPLTLILISSSHSREYQNIWPEDLNNEWTPVLRQKVNSNLIYDPKMKTLDNNKLLIYCKHW